MPREQLKMMMHEENASPSLNSAVIGYYNFDTIPFNDAVAPFVNVTNGSNVTNPPALISNGRSTTINNATAVTSGTDNTRKYDMAGSKPFSFSTWVKFSATAATGSTFILSIENNPFTTYQAAIIKANATNKIQFVIRSSSSDYLAIETTATVTTNVWYNIAVTYNGNGTISGMNVYINGVIQPFTNISVGTFTSTITLPNAFRIFIGGSGITTGYFLGLQDETGIFNRVLTQSEVTYLYNGGAGVAYPYSI